MLPVNYTADAVLAALDEYQKHLIEIIEDDRTIPEMRAKALTLLAHISVVLTHEVMDSRAAYLN